MSNLLDNIVWHTLQGPHARYAEGLGAVRRYAAGFPPFAAFADTGNPDLATLAQYVAAGEQIYCDGWAAPAPAGWHIESESELQKMVWNTATPTADTTLETILLGPQHQSAILDLAALTSPGPFTVGSMALGDYLGVFDGPRLLAMGGGRLCAGGYREISGVCTHPAYQGQGMAKKLVSALLHRHAQHHEKSFLRVMRANEAAFRLYVNMGFQHYGTSVARVISYY
ncbi:GNAT family N-acetyltransferase [Undibacterium sp. Ji50W]|uniref:GNAT family N-acetyltransferase n=1 Tax=Undibacterium sp. Ji50W TaxID=3413041 RepID=UPI003BF15ABF